MGYTFPMDPASTLRTARRRAGLTQSDLAARAATSQATISRYESGHKQPSVTTFSRLLAAAGWRLSLDPAPRPVLVASSAQLADAGSTLEEVLALAAALPTRHEPALRFPRLPLS